MFQSREVAAGPTVGIKGQDSPAASPTAYASVPAYLHPKEVPAAAGRRNGFSLGRESYEGAGEERGGVESSESSSIGVPGESSLSLSSSEGGGDGGGPGGEEEEVQSKLKTEPLGSLESLEESLPIKRGLSSHFAGKSKSFASLPDAALASSSASYLAKPENPFNKRRRILMAACKWPRRASCSSLDSSLLLPPPLLIPSSSPPLHSLEESEEEEEEEEEERGGGESPHTLLAPLLPHHQGRGCRKTFRSPRSFSLTDLKRAQLP